MHPLKRNSSCSECNINSPVVNRICPDCVHRVSQSPSTARLNIAFMLQPEQFSFTASYIVGTFQVPILKVFLVEKRVIGIVASFRLSPQHVICPGKTGPASSRTEVLVSFAVHVSVAVFFTRWGAGPTLDPPRLSDGLGTVHGGSSPLPMRIVYYFNPNIHGWKRRRGRLKPRWADSIKHNLNCVGLTPPMQPRWSLTDPNGRASPNHGTL